MATAACVVVATAVTAVAADATAFLYHVQANTQLNKEAQWGCARHADGP
jgi:hypothetical protein